MNTSRLSRRTHWVARVVAFSALLPLALWFLEARAGIVTNLFPAMFWAVVGAAVTSATLEWLCRVPSPTRGGFLSQLPWYAMQTAVAGLVLYGVHTGAALHGKPPPVGAAILIAFVAALLATGIVAKLLDWLLIARAALARRVGDEGETQRSDLSSARTAREIGDLPEQRPRLWIG